MLKRMRSKTDPSVWKDHSFIGKQTVVSGDVSFHGGLHVEGRVEGHVSSTDGCLHLHGEIRGDITVPNAVINGVVHGDISCSERLELAAGAQVFGTVTYHEMEMMLGAQVTGHLQPAPRPLLKAVQDPAA